MASDLPPSFFLYGEPVRAADPQFIHLENLADRSRPSDWTIAPHRHDDLNHLILITRGSGTIRFESETGQFRAPCLLIVPSRVVHGFQWQEESDGMVLTIADVHMSEAVARFPDFAHLFGAPRFIELDERHRGGMSRVMGVLERELSWSGLGQAAAIESALLMVLVHVARMVQQVTATGEAATPKQVGLLARYRQLVEKRFRLREPVADYARELAVSVTTLRVACAAAGQSPTEMRDQRAIVEAQRMLAYTNESVAGIGEAIGISDPAYFSRFFSRHCGQSPDGWRKSVRRRAPVHPA